MNHPESSRNTNTAPMQPGGWVLYQKSATDKTGGEFFRRVSGGGSRRFLAEVLRRRFRRRFCEVSRCCYVYRSINQLLGRQHGSRSGAGCALNCLTRLIHRLVSTTVPHVSLFNPLICYSAVGLGVPFKRGGRGAF